MKSYEFSSAIRKFIVVENWSGAVYWGRLISVSKAKNRILIDHPMGVDRTKMKWGEPIAHDPNIALRWMGKNGRRGFNCDRILRFQIDEEWTEKYGKT